MPTVVLLGTLDTKGDEYAFLRDRVREHGVDVRAGRRRDHGRPARRPGHHAARRSPPPPAPTSGALAEAGDRGAAVEAMAEGAAEIVEQLHADGRLDGILGLGGSGGSSIVTQAMRRLPVGVPKLMVSTVASGDTRPYVGVTDVTMMYSVVDIAGHQPDLGADPRRNAAGMIAGVVTATVPDLGDEKPLDRRARCSASRRRA